MAKTVAPTPEVAKEPQPETKAAPDTSAPAKPVAPTPKVAKKPVAKAATRP